MAIVENRSTEIGDVIRIQTDVPIIGLISLNAFADNTEGELTGGSSSNNTIQPLVDPRKADSSIVYTIFSGQFMYAVVRSNDGTATNKGIAMYDMNAQTWDTNYPDCPDDLRGINISGNFLYGLNFRIEENNYILSIRRIDLTTRLWSDVSIDGLTVLGVLRVPLLRVFKVLLAKRVFNDKMWMIAGNRIASYDIVLNSWNDYTAGSIVRGHFTIDTINARLYMNSDVNDPTASKNRLAVWDIGTTSFLPLTSDLTTFVSQIRVFNFNPDDGLIYALFRHPSFSSGTHDLLAIYNPVTDFWTASLNPRQDLPPFRYSVTSFAVGDRFYVTEFGTTYLYDIPNSVWLESAPASKFFEKMFRYSIDGGLNFTEFMPLDAINIENITVQQKDQFVLEATYQRAGTDITGELVFNSFTLSGTFDELLFPIYDTTIFKRLFEINDVNVLGWAINVLEKMYQRGLLPDYVDRNREGKDDRDFITYWNSVTHLFALLVYWARNFENIAANKTLLVEFLSNFDITLPFDQNLADLGYIYSNRPDEYRKRGTHRITFANGENGEQVDGELLRLIDREDTDEFIWALIEISKFGWCIGESSPTWTGTEGIVNLTKAYEFSQQVQDLTSYPLLNETDIDIFEDTAISLDVLRISGHAGGGDDTGIGYADPGTPTRSFLRKVDPSLDYEISFRIKKLSTADDNLVFGATGYDENFTRVSLVPIDGTGLFPDSFFNTNASNRIPNADQYYWFRGVVFNSSQAFDNNLRLNFPNGRGLRLSSTVRYVAFWIYAESAATSANLHIYDVKLRPLNLPISQGLFGVKNIIAGYLNNDGELTNENTRLFIQNKLIPYNSFLIPKWL